MIEYPTDDRLVMFAATSESFKITAGNCTGYCWYFVSRNGIDPFDPKSEVLFLEWEEAKQLRDLLNEVLAEVEENP